MPARAARGCARARAGAALSGASAIYLQADLTRGARDEPFLVTETNAISIGESHSNFPAYDGQWRQAVWAFVARGARMVEYWHWHSIHFGHETYWLGVLGHDGEPGRCYAEVKRIAGELQRAGVCGGRPRARRRRRGAVLASRASGRWSSSRRWPARTVSSPTAAPTSGFSRGSTRACSAPACRPTSSTRSSWATDADALVARWPVLVVPALYVADDALLERARRVRAGGWTSRARLPQRLRRRGGARARRRSCPAGSGPPSARATASTRT